MVIALWSRIYYYPHFTEDKVKASGSQVTFLKSYLMTLVFWCQSLCHTSPPNNLFWHIISKIAHTFVWTKKEYIWNKMLKLKLELDTELQQMWNTSVSYKSLNRDFQRKWGSICSSLLHSADFHIINGLQKHRGKILCRYFFRKSCCLPFWGRTEDYDPSSPSLWDPIKKSMQCVLWSWEK